MAERVLYTPSNTTSPLSQVATDLTVPIRLGGLGRVETFPNTKYRFVIIYLIGSRWTSYSEEILSLMVHRIHHML